jgi:hypothetical protein
MSGRKPLKAYCDPASLLVRDGKTRGQGSMLDVVVSVLIIPSKEIQLTPQFPDGILFPDTIEVNFSVTVDPNSRRLPADDDTLQSVLKVGQQLPDTAGQVTAVGDLSKHGTDTDWPTINPVPLAGFLPVTMAVQTTDCYTEIIWLNPDQQIQASYVKVMHPVFTEALRSSELGLPASALHQPELLLASPHPVRPRLDPKLLAPV